MCIFIKRVYVQVRGLCGTLTWTPHDDFITPDGDIENNVPSFAKKFTTEHCFLPGGAPPNACTTFTQKRHYAEAVCFIIHTTVFQVAYTYRSKCYFLFCYSSSNFYPCPFALFYCRRVMMWWTGSTISVSACQRPVDAFLGGCVTVLLSLLTPNTALRRALP